MGRRSDEVRRDIHQARGELGETLEAIGVGVAPGKVVARAKETVAEKVDDVREKVTPTRVVKRRTRACGAGCGVRWGR